MKIPSLAPLGLIIYTGDTEHKRKTLTKPCKKEEGTLVCFFFLCDKYIKMSDLNTEGFIVSPCFRSSHPWLTVSTLNGHGKAEHHGCTQVCRHANADFMVTRETERGQGAMFSLQRYVLCDPLPPRKSHVFPLPTPNSLTISHVYTMSMVIVTCCRHLLSSPFPLNPFFPHFLPLQPLTTNSLSGWGSPSPTQDGMSMGYPTLKNPFRGVGD